MNSNTDEDYRVYIACISPLSFLFSSFLFSMLRPGSGKHRNDVSHISVPTAGRELCEGWNAVQRWCLLKLIYQARGRQGPICGLIAWSCDLHRLRATELEQAMSSQF